MKGAAQKWWACHGDDDDATDDDGPDDGNDADNDDDNDADNDAGNDADAQVGEHFPLLQRPLHSFPRQQCHRPQGGNHR